MYVCIHKMCIKFSFGGDKVKFASERLVDIRITKFYVEKVLPSVNYLFIYLQAVNFFAQTNRWRHGPCPEKCVRKTVRYFLSPSWEYVRKITFFIKGA
jgi:hypothetical protein